MDDALSLDLSPLAAMNVPHLEQYFGYWSILEDVFRRGVDHVGRMDLVAHVHVNQEPAAIAAASARANADFQLLDGGVAVVSLSGSLMKFTSSLSSGTSTVAARRQVRAAMNDDEVKAILLRIDSPGGTVSGTQDLADDVAAAAKKKPVYAYIEDLGASAAYWIASQASKVYANGTALIGSIGTFAVVQDLSALAAQRGIKVHVIRAGQHKGTGVPGTEVTTEQLVEMQRMVNDLNAQFLAAVTRGRNLSADDVAKLADGRVHVGDAARALGLIDAVQSLDATIGQLRAPAKPPSKGTRSMSEKTDSPVAATFREIRSALPKADEKFVVAQLEKGSTLDQARNSWAEDLSARLESQGQELATARTEIEALKKENAELKATATAKKPGVPTLKTETKPGATAASGASAKDQFQAAVEEKVKGGLSRPRAIAAVVRESPEMQAAFIAEANEGRKQS